MCGLHDRLKQLLVFEIMQNKLITTYINQWQFSVVLEKFTDRRTKKDPAIEFFSDLVSQCHKKISLSFGNRANLVQRIFIMATRRSSDIADTLGIKRSQRHQVYTKITETLKHQMRKAFDINRAKTMIEGPSGPKNFTPEIKNNTKKYFLVSLY